jgi:hypothetical protein
LYAKSSRWISRGFIIPTYKILEKGGFTKVQKILSLDILFLSIFKKYEIIFLRVTEKLF